MRRRDVLKIAAYATGAMASNWTQAQPLSGRSPGRAPITQGAASAKIDAHIHLFDTSRPGGVPWPLKTDTALYKPALPDRYRSLSAPFDIVGAVAIEASYLPTDNDWLLSVAEKSPIIVGVIGDLIPGAKNYHSELKRLQANSLFRGIRYGNLWGRDLFVDLDKPGFVEGLRDLEQADLVLEGANPDLRLLRALLNVSEKIAGLRIVVDHLPNAQVPNDQESQQAFWALLHQLGQNERAFVKLSEIPVVENGKLVTSPAFYRDHLDALWEIFGEERVLFGSDWPNSDHVASLSDTLHIVEEYIAQKSPKAAAMYYRKNSIRVYKWRPRLPEQQNL